jgi:hypothetical protein
MVMSLKLYYSAMPTPAFHHYHGGKHLFWLEVPSWWKHFHLVVLSCCCSQVRWMLLWLVPLLHAIHTKNNRLKFWEKSNGGNQGIVYCCPALNWMLADKNTKENLLYHQTTHLEEYTRIVA